MRILHVWDCAGVSGILAKYQRKLGHEVTVVSRDGYDGFKQKEYYGAKIIGPKRRRFKDFGILQKPLRLTHRTISVVLFYGWIMANAHRYDVIHIHTVFLVDLFLPCKPKIVEFHGDDIRSRPSRRWGINKAVTNLYLKLNSHRMFLVSTPDLLKELPNSVWLPNPVDTELFQNTGVESNNKAVYFHNWYESGEHALELCKKNNWNLTVVDRAVNQYMTYKDVPGYLKKFDYMIDRKMIPSLSKTALEALATGCKVIGWSGTTIEELPPEHNPLTVAKCSLNIYEKIIRGKKN